VCGLTGVTMLLRLTYFSDRSPDCPPSEVAEIVAAAAAANRRRQITGMMVADATVFVQTLEGHRNAVTALFTRIARDPRHCNVVLVESVEIARRSYPEWGMVAVDDPQAVDAAWGLLGGDAMRAPWSMSAAALDAFLFAAARVSKFDTSPASATTA
jgi:Sensors of blue-light using FAD